MGCGSSSSSATSENSSSPSSVHPLPLSSSPNNDTTIVIKSVPHRNASTTTGGEGGETSNAPTSSAPVAASAPATAPTNNNLGVPNMPNVRRGRRLSVSAESDRDASASTYVKKKIDKPAEAVDRIRRSCKKSILFTGLEEGQQQEIFDAMGEVRVKAGDEIIKQDSWGDYFYVIDGGEFEVLKRDDKKSPYKKVFQYNNEGSFGELALMYNCPRAATVKAVTDGVLWRVDRETFRHIIIETTEKKRKMFEEFLEKVPLLSNLTKQERSKIADCLETCSFNDGEKVITQGEHAECFYFIINGEAIATQTPPGKTEEIEVGRMKTGQYFGERALITNEPRAANVIATAGKLECAMMERQAFERLFGDVKTIMQRQIHNYKKAGE